MPAASVAMPDVALPNFDAPPVNEVVLGVSFKPIPGLRSVGLTSLWAAQFRADFPKVEERPPYEAYVEILDRAPIGPGFTLGIGVGTAPPPPRFWLIDDQGESVVQIQHDWFAVNWRKVGEATPYRRYPFARDAFEANFKKFSAHLKESELGEVSISQCEITYVNLVDPGGIWESHGQLARAIVLAGQPRGSFLTEMESIQVSATALIKSNHSTVGRLHITAQPAYRDEDKPIILLTLTARGVPQDNSPTSALDFFDIGHEWIVRSFADVTSEGMHRLWRRND